MKGSLPPSSSTAFLICAPALGPTETPAPSLPVSVTAAMRGIVDQRRHPVRSDEERLEGAFGKTRFAEDLLDREGAVGDVRGVLEEADVAGHERRRREAEDLPEGEVPGHDGEDRAERVVADEAAARRRSRRARRPGNARRSRRRSGRPRRTSRPRPRRRRSACPSRASCRRPQSAFRPSRTSAGASPSGRRARPGTAAPARELLRRERDAALDLGLGVRLERPQGLAGRGVDGGDRHG